MKKTSLVFSLKISSTFLTNYNEVSESESDASDDDLTKRDTEQESSGDEDDRTMDTETELSDADGSSDAVNACKERFSQFKDLLQKCELNDIKAAVLEKEMVFSRFEGLDVINPFSDCEIEEFIDKMVVEEAVEKDAD